MIIDRINGVPFAATSMRYPSNPRIASDELDLGPSAIGYLLGLILKTMRSQNDQAAVAGLSDHLLRDIGLTRTEASWRPARQSLQ
jgi:hypothetical protein